MIQGSKAFIPNGRANEQANNDEEQVCPGCCGSRRAHRTNLRISSAAHPLHHKMRNLATFGFPAPDADHQKHVSSYGETLNMARLYSAMWMQIVAECVRRSSPWAKLNNNLPRSDISMGKKGVMLKQNKRQMELRCTSTPAPDPVVSDPL